MVGAVRFCLLLLFGVISAPFLLGQNNPIRFRRLTIESGISQSSVRCVVQDHRGFMWFGTEDGLNRYDGYNFKIYKHDSRDPKSLSQSFIRCLFEDSRKVLWAGTLDGGLNRYDREKETFTHFRFDPEDPNSLSDDGVRVIQEDSGGRLWIGTYQGGLNRYDRESGGFVRYQVDSRDPESISSNEIRSIHEDRHGFLWIGTREGLNRFDPERGNFSRYPLGGNEEEAEQEEVWAITEDAVGVLWVGTDGALYSYDRQGNRFVRYVHNPSDPQSLSHNRVWALEADPEGGLWVGTLGGGLNYLDTAKKRFRVFKEQPGAVTSLTHDVIWDIFRDREGIFWVGTGEGLAMFDPLNNPFYNYYRDPHDPNSLSEDDIRAIYRDDRGYLWVGTSGGGLNRIDRNTRRRKLYTREPGRQDSLSHEVVKYLYEDRAGAFWVGTDFGLNKMLDAEKGRFRRYLPEKGEPGRLQEGRISAIYEDRKNRFWIGTRGGGVHLMDRATGDFFAKQHDPDNPKSLSDNWVVFLHDDSRDRLWVGTFGGGLNLFDRQTNEFTHFLHQPESRNSISSNHLRAIHEDRHGLLWIGTEGGGVNRFDPDALFFRVYRRQDGLANNVVHGILEDARGHLWMSTNNGLCRFNPDMDTFETYTIHDGLPGNEFANGAFFGAKTGEMFFGGNKGMTAFFPERVKPNTNPPTIVITDFLLFNQSVPTVGNSPDSPLERNITEADKIELFHTDEVFSFEFAALHFNSPERNRYAYMMEGFDQDWVETGADKRFATYMRLKPGNYRFRVKASNKDQVWSREEATVEVRIKAPPWRTWWAFTLYAITLITLVVGLILYQSRALKAERRKMRRERNIAQRERVVAQELRRIGKQKDAFLANTSHELRTPLNGIIGLAESLVDGVAGDLPEKADYNLSLIIRSGKRLGNLVNDLLDFSKLQNKTVELQQQTVDLHTLTETVFTLSEPLVQGKNLVLVNGIEEAMPPVFGDESRLQQIMHNLVGNAVKFTREGKIQVTAARKGAEIEISVSDTGIGIPQERFHEIFEAFEQGESGVSKGYGGTGLGLAITRLLIEAHGGHIKVESSVGKGSIFTFYLPVEPFATEAEPDRVSSLALAPPLGKIAVPAVPAKPEVDQPDKEGDSFDILIVDDEPVNRQVLMDQLSMRNYALTEAADGPTALDIIHSGKVFDLVLLDIMMPRMSGYEVCREIRKSYSSQELPILFLTAKNQVMDLAHGFEAGANDYLTKPVTKHELLPRIQTHLKNLEMSRYLKAARDAASAGVLATEEAELANSILHNIANVVTSILISVEQLQLHTGHSKINILQEAGSMLRDHNENLVQFLQAHPKGALFADCMTKVERALLEEHHYVTKEIDEIAKRTELMKDIIRIQQDQAKSSMEIQAYALNDLVEEAVKIKETYLERNQIAVSRDFARNIMVNVQSLHATNVLINLLKNAVEAMDSCTEQRLIISTGVMDDGQGFVTVRDFGVGIEGEDLSRLFTYGFSRKKKGHGFGLHYCLKVMRDMGGDLMVESEGKGKGAAFTLTFPRA